MFGWWDLGLKTLVWLQGQVTNSPTPQIIFFKKSWLVRFPHFLVNTQSMANFKLPEVKDPDSFMSVLSRAHVCYWRLPGRGQEVTHPQFWDRVNPIHCPVLWIWAHLSLLEISSVFVLFLFSTHVGSSLPPFTSHPSSTEFPFVAKFPLLGLWGSLLPQMPPVSHAPCHQSAFSLHVTSFRWLFLNHSC